MNLHPIQMDQLVRDRTAAWQADADWRRSLAGRPARSLARFAGMFAGSATRMRTRATPEAPASSASAEEVDDGVPDAVGAVLDTAVLGIATR